jgi:hypothetical protein
MRLSKMLSEREFNNYILGITLQRVAADAVNNINAAEIFNQGKKSCN